MKVTTPERDGILHAKFLKAAKRHGDPIRALLAYDNDNNVDPKVLEALRDRFKEKNIYHIKDWRK